MEENFIDILFISDPDMEICFFITIPFDRIVENDEFIPLEMMMTDDARKRRATDTGFPTTIVQIIDNDCKY